MPPVTPEESHAQLRKDRDAARQEAAAHQGTLTKLQAELEAAKARLLPDDLELPEGTTDPIAFIRSSVTASKELPQVNARLAELQSRVEMYDITASEVWTSQVTARQSKAMDDIQAALGDYRLEADPARPGSTKLVLRNQDFVTKAFDALKSAPDHSLASVKAALATVTDNGSPDPNTVKAVSAGLHVLLEADAAANNLKTNWSTAKEQAEAARIRKAQEDQQTRMSEYVQNFGALASEFDVPEYADAIPAARAAAIARFTAGVKAPSIADAVEVQIKASLFDAAIEDARKWRKHAAANSLQNAANNASGPSPAATMAPAATQHVASWLQ